MSKWEMVKIEDVCEILDSRRVPITASDRKGGIYPYYGANGVQDYVSDYIFDDELVLLAEDGGNFGSKTKPIAYRVSGKCWVNNHAHVLKAKPMLDIDYLCYSIMFYDVSKIISGTTRAKLNQSAMRKMTIPLPHLETQKQIAKTLDTAAELLDMRKQQIAELDILIKAVFYDMFGDPMINKKRWEVKRLGEICDIVRGGSPRPIENFLGGEIPWIKIGDATEGENIYLNKTKEHIKIEGVKKSRLIPAGSMIFANCGVSLGFARIITFDGCIHDGWLAFNNISDQFNKIFLLKQLNEKTIYFRRKAPGGTQPNLNTDIMKNSEVIHPPYHLQCKFAEIVIKIEEQKALVKKAIDETQSLFDCLMSQYFE